MSDSKEGWVKYKDHMKEVVRQAAEIERLCKALDDISTYAELCGNDCSSSIIIEKVDAALKGGK